MAVTMLQRWKIDINRGILTMAARDKIDQLKTQVERMRRESLDVVSKASRIVFEGVQKLAEQELKALNDYYKSATGALKSPRSGSSYQDLAAEQLDLLQDTVQKVLGHARESLGIIAETRAELTRLIGSGGPLDSRALSKVTAPAQKAIDDVRKAAAKAQKSASKTAKDLRKALDKEIASAEKKGRKAARRGEARAREAGESVRNKLESVLDLTPPAPAKKAVKARPSPESRAARAASKARKSAPGKRSGSGPSAK